MNARPAQAGGGDRNLRAGANKPGLLTLTIKDKSALYLAYMPFVKNGGLFIPTNSNYRLGDEVFMLLNLMGEDEKLPVAGRVIWVTPKGAQGNQGKRTAGIGVQFSEQDRGQTQKKIETYLAGALSGDKATHTMLRPAEGLILFGAVHQRMRQASGTPAAVAIERVAGVRVHPRWEWGTDRLAARNRARRQRPAQPFFCGLKRSPNRRSRETRTTFRAAGHSARASNHSASSCFAPWRASIWRGARSRSTARSRGTVMCFRSGPSSTTATGSACSKRCSWRAMPWRGAIRCWNASPRHSMPRRC